jgi:hypothetical protein
MSPGLKQTTYVYRAMQADGQHPRITPGRTGGLGIRDRDISADARGLVSPGKEGLSVAPNNPLYLPSHFRPIALGGASSADLWRLDIRVLPSALVFVQTSDRHGVVGPKQSMTLADYILQIESTVHLWSPE